MKKCDHCGKSAVKGQYYCAKCDVELTPLEKRRYTQRRYHWRNKAKRNKMSRDDQRRRAENDPNYYRSRHLKELYGINMDDWDELYRKQKGRCAICGKHSIEFKKRLAVDHNHNTGEVRSLLCHHCNCILGNAFDSIELLTKCIQYLRKYNNDN